MEPATYTLPPIQRGLYYSQKLTFLQSVGGAAMDLTGYTVTAPIAGAGDFSVSVPTPTNGEVTISLSATTTASMAGDSYEYSVNLTPGTGNDYKQSYLRGVVPVMDGITT